MCRNHRSVNLQAISMPNEQGKFVLTQTLEKEIQAYIFGMRQSTSLISNFRASTKNKGFQLSESITSILVLQTFPFHLDSKRRKMLVLLSQSYATKHCNFICPSMTVGVNKKKSNFSIMKRHLMPSEQIIKFKSNLTLKFFTTIINYTTSPTLTFHCSEEQTQQYIPASNFGRLSSLLNLSIPPKYQKVVRCQTRARKNRRKIERKRQFLINPVSLFKKILGPNFIADKYFIHCVTLYQQILTLSNSFR